MAGLVWLAAIAAALCLGFFFVYGYALEEDT